MPPIPQQLIAPVSAASYDGRLWAAWPNGDKPGQNDVVAPVFTKTVGSGYTMDAVYEVIRGDTVSGTVTLSAGSSSESLVFFKIEGPDDLIVDPFTGAWSWMTTAADKGAGYNVRIGCCNVVDPYGDWIDFIIVVQSTPGAADILLVGTSRTYTTISAAMSAATSGDVIIIDRGTYTGSSNAINDAQKPASGTLNQFTTIMARGIPAPDLTGVILDGQNARNMVVASGNRNVSATWSGKSGSGAQCDYIKLSGVVDKNPADGQSLNGAYTRFWWVRSCFGYSDYVGNIGSSCAFSYARDFLFENTATWGSNQRYGGGSYRCNTAGSGESGDGHSRYLNHTFRKDGYQPTESQPCGGIQNYSNVQQLFSGCMVMDGNLYNTWTAHEYWGAAFGNAASDDPAIPYGNVWRRCLSINNSMGFIDSGAQDTTAYTNYYDCVDYHHVQSTNSPVGSANPPIYIGNRGAIRLERVGALRAQLQSGTYAPFTNFGYQALTIVNSVISEPTYNWSTHTSSATPAWTYNGGTVVSFNYVGVYNPAGASMNFYGSPTITNAITLTSDIYSQMRYLVRAEPNSAVLTAGQSGASIAPSIMTQWGKSGRFYGESGYDEETTIPFWPMALEREKRAWMRSYSYTGINLKTGGTGNISGARGACADDTTFTSYAWGQVGTHAVPPFRVCARQSGANVEIRWQPGEAGARTSYKTSYKVYEIIAGSPSLVATVSGALNRCVVSAPSAGSHTYAVTAVDSDRAEGGWSYAVAVTVS